MSEKLISADDALKYTVLAGEIRNQYMEVIPAYFVKEAPAVDAVEVVRCRDCKYRTEYFVSGKYVCAKWQCTVCGSAYYVEEDDFCSWGERRDENAVD